MELCLTQRDQRMLRFLHEQGVATSYQLTALFFPSRQAFFNRASALSKQGLVTVHKVRRKVHGGQAYLYTLGESLKTRFVRGLEFTEDRMLAHQLALNDVRIFLQRELGDPEILTDPMIHQEMGWAGGQRNFVVPDLLLRLRGRQVAVEVERTRKAPHRYLNRWTAFESTGWSHVLYFCESDRLKDDLSRLAHRFPRIGFTNLLELDEVFSVSGGHQRLRDFLSKEFQKYEVRL